MNRKNFIELSRLKTLEERFIYLKTNGSIGIETFGNQRYLNQDFYLSQEWRSVRRKVIVRDNGNEMGLDRLSYIRFNYCSSYYTYNNRRYCK